MEERKHIIILTDYRDQFYSTSKRSGRGFDLKKLSSLFIENGYHVTVKNFCDVDFKKENYRGNFVLYQSSEDPGLQYKDYIEDILLGIELQKGILIPEFKYFRAHHNKVFSEILRDTSSFSLIKNIKARYFGTYEDFRKKSENLPDQLSVVKPASGSRSKNIFLAKNKNELLRFTKFVSYTSSFFNLSLLLDYLFSKRKKIFFISNNRKKFIVQEYISDLAGDYKVLVYGEKIFPLFRVNRKNDFRASGSGNFIFSTKVPHEILDCALKLKSYFSVPFISIDIAYKNKSVYVFEYQFVMFGQYALEGSPGFFRKEDEKWNFIESKTFVEKAFFESVDIYIKQYLIQ